MNIVYDKPPVWGAALEAFPKLQDYKPIFAWGNVIYQPCDRRPLADYLIAHERVHGLRQLTVFRQVKHTEEDINAACWEWWGKYLSDPAFRLAEEIPAHQAEMATRWGGITTSNGKAARTARRRIWREVADRLNSPIYNYPRALLHREKALRLLKDTPV